MASLVLSRQINVHALQRGLYMAAKQNGKRKFPALPNRIARPDVLRAPGSRCEVTETRPASQTNSRAGPAQDLEAGIGKQTRQLSDGLDILGACLFCQLLPGHKIRMLASAAE